MDIAVHSCAARRGRVARVTEVEEDKSAAACGVSRPCTNNVGKIRLRVRKHVVCATIRELAIETSKIFFSIEDFWAAVVDIQEL